MSTKMQDADRLCACGNVLHDLYLEVGVCRDRCCPSAELANEVDQSPWTLEHLPCTLPGVSSVSMDLFRFLFPKLFSSLRLNNSLLKFVDGFSNMRDIV